MYKTILIPLDNSAADAAILAHIQPLAKMAGSRLILMHVADGHVARNQAQLNLEDSDEMRKDREYLDECRRGLVAAGFDVSVELRLGDPVSQILAVAEQEHCDLIAMATHGHGIIKDALLGTVASQLRHRTDLPVLLLRARVA